MIWAQFLRWICMNLRFMRIFPQLHLILALSSFDCRCECFGPSLRRKARIWAKLGQESSKTSPIGPKEEDPMHIPRSKRSSKSSVREASRPDPAGATTGRSWCSPQPVVVDARPCCLGRTVRPLAPNFWFFFVAFRFPAQLFDFYWCFDFKRGVYLALMRGRIYSKNSLSFSKTPSKKKKEEEGWWSQSGVFGGESKDRHSSIA